MKLSVIIPVYNAEDSLSTCLESVLRTEGIDMEVICVDDGSTDATASLLSEIAGKDSRLRWKTCAHAGVSSTRNAALEMVQGDYITFVDSDDTIEPWLLPALLEAAVETGADCVVSGWVQQSRKGWRSYPLAEIQEELPAVASVVAKLPTSPWGRVYSARVVNKSQARFCLSVQYGEDALFHYFLYPWCNKVVLLPGAGYKYFETPGSLSSRKRETVINLLDAAADLAAYYAQMGLLPERKDMFLRFCLFAVKCVRSLAPHSIQKEAAARLCRVLRSVHLEKRDLAGLSSGDARLLSKVEKGEIGVVWDITGSGLADLFEEAPEEVGWCAL